MQAPVDEPRPRREPGLDHHEDAPWTHDSRGVLSYWRGGVGAYGYLIHAFAENEILRQIAASKDSLRLRFTVPADGLAQGGLSIYGAECGRFPVCPTVILEWSDGDVSGGTYHRQNGVGGLGHISGSVTQAQNYLDGKSGCTQPCRCPPWRRERSRAGL